ncbi:hypothetical protein ACIPMW_32200 [Streptomyces sp. NPDC086669]|uniref:hypothetical protein n=1 Tax=Streptomyces sp. NPDC086669 TaxID=3365753 RepID=UPI0037FC7083
MGGELQADLGPVVVTRDQRRAAALHVAEHPHHTAAQLAANPHARAELRAILTQLGLIKEQK